MAYELVGWKDYPDKTTKVNAENLKKMDNQIKTNADNIGEIEKIADIADGTLAGAVAGLMPQNISAPYYKFVSDQYDNNGGVSNLDSELQTAASYIADLNEKSGNTADFVVSEESKDGFYIRKWNSGKCEAWAYIEPVSMNITTAWGTDYIGPNKEIALPTGLFSSVNYASVQTIATTEIPVAHMNSVSTSKIQIYVSNSRSATISVGYDVYVLGTYDKKEIGSIL